jgi:hypothetical protein
MFLRCAAIFLAGAGLASAADLRYYIEPCTRPETACHKEDPQLAEWALKAWQAASGGMLHLEKVTNPERAQIRIHWADGAGGLYGEAQPILVDGKRGANVFVLPDTTQLGPDIAREAGRDPLLRDAIVYLTCLHETGHALGLQHTAAFPDIMYSFQYGGDIPEYFGRYRRKLNTRGDIERNPGMSPQDQLRLAGALAPIL